MKICLLNVLHEPYDKRVFQKIARSLVGAGHEVTSICPVVAASPPRLSVPTQESRGRDKDVASTKDGVHFQYIPAANSLPQRLVSVARLVVKGRRVPADVYYAPEPESWVAALILKVFTGRKVVFDMHEHVPTEFAKFFPKFAQPFMTQLTARFMRIFARLTDYVILTRESFEPLWAGLRVPRVVVLNTNHLQPACSEVPEELRGRYAGKPVIIHQGIFGDVRGSYQLLDAMKLLVREIPELLCIILGRYEYGSETHYRGAILAAGLNEHMDLLGVVPYEEVAAHIAVARVGLILFQPGPLNHTLAMPHKLFDYMREGKPVVAPDFAVEVARIVREADCGLLVDVAQPEKIAAAVLFLLQNQAEAARLGANGRRLVEEKYNWQAEEQRLLRAFESLQRKNTDGHGQTRTRTDN